MIGQFNLDDQAIINRLGIASSSEEFRRTALTRIGELLDQRMAVRVSMLLNDDELIELDKIGNDQPAFLAYIAAHVPDIDDVIEDELNAIVTELKSFLN